MPCGSVQEGGYFDKLSGLGGARNCSKLTCHTVQLEPGQKLTGGVGTYNYMPPERLNKKPYDYPSDVWGLGVLLFAMIAGRLPFLSQTRQGVLDQVCGWVELRR